LFSGIVGFGLIELRDIAVDFGLGEVVSGVSLTVPRGSFWGLVGPGGGGKSVLLKTICALVAPTRGEVLLGGVSVTKAKSDELKKIRSSIGMLFQHNALFDFMTIGQNVMFPLTQRKVPVEEARERAQRRLEMVDLPMVFDKFPNQLSGGMRKRVGVARAIIAGPEFVLYDEPTAGLDPVTSSKIFSMLRREQREGNRTVITISNDIDNLLKYVDHIAMLHKGKLLYAGDPGQVNDAKDPAVRQFFRGEIEGPL
jgi:phospholipid/cholesterol/gamma-HCH transport system ATP-binding protein